MSGVKTKLKKDEIKSESFDNFRDRVLIVCATVKDSYDDAPQTTIAAQAKSVVERTVLYYTEPAKNSDKVYIAEIVRVANTSALYNHIVTFAYGKRGGTMKEGIKTDHPVSLVQARNVYNDLIWEKKKKGYTEDVSGGIR
jgi:predicted DNA-binding WGR domain protein